ncbi:related to integral membrane protein PTH11 [Cephalotrichum gorgonifer]|uniref:Related to integral membrane protein PTH11 n=1 Tax=Cephalotrichum gorgonifer TaxID=2041049 RepID=A0AAE8MYA6_9PEZI|nr:related to integral membrane protein PTH11 [Cephalotrichum gorgonifer]
MAEIDFTQLSPAELDAMLDLPAMQPPSDQFSNFDNPPNQNGLAIGVIAACTSVVVLCLGIRLYAKLALMRKAQVQEYLIVAAFLVHIAGVFYTACLPLLKISILLEWLGMFVPRGTRNWFFWSAWIMIGIQAAFGIAIIIALNLACIPTRKKWEFWLPGKCFNAHNVETASAAFQLASDCFVLFIPQKIIWDLKMSWKKRLGVSFIFSLGVLACVSAAFRLAVTIDYADAVDSIYNIGPVCFWAFAEMTCGFIVVCVPCIPKILIESGTWRKMKRGLGMSTTAGGSGATPKHTGNSSAVRSKNLRSANDSYQELDDHTEMKNLGSSESAEYLHTPRARLENGIVRTTQVAVTHDSDVNSEETMRYTTARDPRMQWR